MWDLSSMLNTNIHDQDNFALKLYWVKVHRIKHFFDRYTFKNHLKKGIYKGIANKSSRGMFVDSCTLLLLPTSLANRHLSMMLPKTKIIRAQIWGKKNPPDCRACSSKFCWTRKLLQDQIQNEENTIYTVSHLSCFGNKQIEKIYLIFRMGNTSILNGIERLYSSVEI